MNWLGQQQGQGYEYHVLIIGIGIAAALLVTGGGRWSVDREVAERIAQ